MKIATPRYRTVTVKLSGEALGTTRTPHGHKFVEAAEALAEAHKLGVRITVVVGGGNIFRGRGAGSWPLTPQSADNAGMLATGINALLLEGSLDELGVRSRIYSRGPCIGIGVPYNQTALINDLEQGLVTIIAGGMGVPGMSTDVPACDAAVSTRADALIFCKNGVDGLYDADPKTVPDCHFIPVTTATNVLDQNLKIMDASALELARNNGKPIHVVAASNKWVIRDILEGRPVGSVILPL